MSTTAKDGYPSQYEHWISLKNDKEIFLRPILPTDEPLLVDLFNKLSDQSRYLRFLSHHHVLSEDMLYHFTHIDYDSEFALVAVIKEDGKDAIIAVGRYMLDPSGNFADLAIAVRDDWQHFGLGKSLLGSIVDIGRDHGISRFESIMDPRNDIVKMVLQELGYDVKYNLRDGVYQVVIVA